MIEREHVTWVRDRARAWDRARVGARVVARGRVVKVRVRVRVRARAVGLGC